MKLILKIARTEIRNLFFSPVAWFLALIFMVICAIYYSETIAMMANYQDSLLKTNPNFKGFPFAITGGLFMNVSENGFIGNIFSNLYLFIPLLTMGLINREFNNGTVKLLYSSPVQLNQIVWGKYLAIMAYNMFLLTIMLMFMIVGAFSIKDIDYGHLLSGLLAFYLVVCAYTAIGMFMSSITNYQIVSAIATFILLYALQRIGGLWQNYDFVRDLTYFMSISGRAERMVAGLVTTRDVMYYVLIAYMFVAFSYLSLRHGRELVSKSVKVARYLFVFVTVMVVGYLSSRPGYIGYWDATRIKINTINEVTQDIIRNMQDEPLEVILYTNLFDPGMGFHNTKPANRNKYIWGFWDPYMRFKPNMNFKYVLYYDVKDGDSAVYRQMPNMTLDSIAKEYAKMYEVDLDRFLPPAAIRKQIDLNAENMRAVMKLTYKGKSIYLRTYEDAKYWPDEDHVAAALKRLATDSIPKVYASVGNLERSIHKKGEREYNLFTIEKLSRSALINNGFEIDTINLNEKDVPADANVLLLADPKTELNQAVRSRVQQYMDKGGNMLISGEPGKQHVLNPVIRSTGTSLMPGTLVQISKDETPDKVMPYMTYDYTWLITPFSTRMQQIRKSIGKGDSLYSLNPGAAGVSYADSGFRMHRMWVTVPERKVWAKAGQLVTDSTAPVFTASEGDYRLDSFNVAVALERKVGDKAQRIVLTGDADYLSTVRHFLHFSGEDYLKWMVHESYPISFDMKDVKDNLLTITLTAATTQKLILVWILPAALLILGSVILLRRKRQ